MKYLRIFIILSVILLNHSCGTIKEGFKNQKKNSSDEFLVEKKSPLVMPPEYGELPVPSKDSNSGRGWVMVNTKKLTTENLILAMEKGDFYASTGIYLKKFYTDHKQIEIVVDPEVGASYEIIFMGYKKGAEEVIELKKVQGTSATYNYQNEDIFVRVRINSDIRKTNPIFDNETKKAWTQPLMLQ